MPGMPKEQPKSPAAYANCADTGDLRDAGEYPMPLEDQTKLPTGTVLPMEPAQRTRIPATPAPEEPQN